MSTFVAAATLRKLDGFARRLRMFGNTTGSTTIAGHTYEIEVGMIGSEPSYSIVSVDAGSQPARRLCEHDFYEDACPHCTQQAYQEGTR